MLGEDIVLFKRGIRVDTVNWILAEQEIEGAEANTAYLDVVSCMEALASKFESASTWEVSLWRT